jgi:hypothetical protein
MVGIYMNIKIEKVGECFYNTYNHPVEIVYKSSIPNYYFCFLGIETLKDFSGNLCHISMWFTPDGISKCSADNLIEKIQ